MYFKITAVDNFTHAVSHLTVALHEQPEVLILNMTPYFLGVPIRLGCACSTSTNAPIICTITLIRDSTDKEQMDTSNFIS